MPEAKRSAIGSSASAGSRVAYLRRSSSTSSAVRRASASVVPFASAASTDQKISSPTAPLSRSTVATVPTSR